VTGSDGKVFVAEEPLSSFEEYAKISIAFEVVAVLDVAEPAENSGPFVLTERRFVVPQ